MGVLPLPPIMNVLVPLVHVTWPARGSWFSYVPNAAGVSTVFHAPSIVSNATHWPRHCAPSVPPLSRNRNASSGVSCANAHGAGAPLLGATSDQRFAARSYAQRSFRTRAPSKPPKTYIVWRSTHAQCP